VRMAPAFENPSGADSRGLTMTLAD